MARVCKLVSLNLAQGLGQQTTGASCYYWEALSIRTYLRHCDVFFLPVVPYFYYGQIYTSRLCTGC